MRAQAAVISLPPTGGEGRVRASPLVPMPSLKTALSLPETRPQEIGGLRAPLLRRLLQWPHGGAHLHLISIAPGDLGIGHKIAAAHLGVDTGLVDTGRRFAVLGKGAGGAQ